VWIRGTKLIEAELGGGKEPGSLMLLKGRLLDGGGLALSIIRLVLFALSIRLAPNFRAEVHLLDSNAPP